MSDLEEKRSETRNKYGFIYITTNNINGKKYIGQRKYYGKYEEYLGSGVILARAIAKYGVENFTRQVVEECDTKEALNEREIFWIDYYHADTSDAFYNEKCGGSGGFGSGVNSPWYGKHLSDEHKRKVSESKLGDKNPFYGKHHSAEARIKMSRAGIGRKYTEEFKKKRSEFMKNNHQDVSGAKNPRARSVIQFDLSHRYIKTFEYIGLASIETGIDRTSIGSCCSGKYKTAGGYIWEYKENKKQKENK